MTDSITVEWFVTLTNGDILRSDPITYESKVAYDEMLKATADWQWLTVHFTISNDPVIVLREHVRFIRLCIKQTEDA